MICEGNRRLESSVLVARPRAINKSGVGRARRSGRGGPGQKDSARGPEGLFPLVSLTVSIF